MAGEFPRELTIQPLTERAPYFERFAGSSTHPPIGPQPGWLRTEVAVTSCRVAPVSVSKWPDTRPG